MPFSDKIICEIHDYIATYYLSSVTVPFRITAVAQRSGSVVLVEKSQNAATSILYVLIAISIPLLICVVIAIESGGQWLYSLSAIHIASGAVLIFAFILLAEFWHILSNRYVECEFDINNNIVTIRSMHRNRSIMQSSCSLAHAKLIACPIRVIPASWCGFGGMVDVGERRFVFVADPDEHVVYTACEELAHNVGMKVSRFPDELILGGQARLGRRRRAVAATKVEPKETACEGPPKARPKM